MTDSRGNPPKKTKKKEDDIPVGSVLKFDTEEVWEDAQDKVTGTREKQRPAVPPKNWKNDSPNKNFSNETSYVPTVQDREKQFDSPPDTAPITPSTIYNSGSSIQSRRGRDFITDTDGSCVSDVAPTDSLGMIMEKTPQKVDTRKNLTQELGTPNVYGACRPQRDMQFSEFGETRYHKPYRRDDSLRDSSDKPKVVYSRQEPQHSKGRRSTEHDNLLGNNEQFYLPYSESNLYQSPDFMNQGYQHPPIQSVHSTGRRTQPEYHNTAHPPLNIQQSDRYHQDQQGKGERSHAFHQYPYYHQQYTGPQFYKDAHTAYHGDVPFHAQPPPHLQSQHYPHYQDIRKYSQFTEPSVDGSIQGDKSNPRAYHYHTPSNIRADQEKMFEKHSRSKVHQSSPQSIRSPPPEYESIDPSVKSQGRYRGQGSTGKPKSTDDVKQQPTTPAKDEPEPVGIKVTNVSEKTTKDTLRNYFESRRSGGGTIQSVKYGKEGEVYIVFEESGVAENVVKRSHKLDDADLILSCYTPPKQSPVDNKKLLVKGLKKSTSMDSTINFLEVKLRCNCNTEDCYFVNIKPDHKDAILILSEDFVLHRSPSLKLEDAHLDIQEVRQPNGVKVTGFKPATTKDSLLYYFENFKRSDGGDIEEVEMFGRLGFAVVHFKDFLVADRVSRKKKHTIDEVDICVEPYYDFLDIDTTLRPEPYKWKGFSKYIIIVLKNSIKLSKDLENLASLCKAKVDWSSSNEEAVQFECLLTGSETDFFTLVDSWQTQLETSLKEYSDRFTTEGIECQENVYNDIKDALTSTQDSVALFVNKNNDPIMIDVTGMKESVQELSEKIRSLMANVKKTSSGNDEKDVSSETISVSLAVIDVMNGGEFKSRMEEKHSGVVIEYDRENNNITAKGPQEKLLAVQLDIFKEQQKITKTDVKGLSDVKLKLLQSSQVLQYITDKLSAQGIIAGLSLNDDSNVLNIHTYEKPIVDEIKKIIHQSIPQRHIEISDNMESLFTDRNSIWVDQESQLDAMHKGLFLINMKMPRLIVCCVDSVIDKIMNDIEDFISVNAVFTKTIKLDCIVWKFLENHGDVHKKMEDKKVQITADAHPCDTHNILVTVSGMKLPLNEANNQIIEMANQVDIKQHIMNDPTSSKYILSTRGQQCLDSIERRHRCAIEVSEDKDNNYTFMESDLSMGASAASSPPTKVCFNIKLPNSISLIGIQGSMADVKAQIYVVPVTSSGKLTDSSLGKSILDRGGKRIEDEINEKRKKYGPLLDGYILTVNCGKLEDKCDTLLLAAIPKWGEDNCFELYQEAVRKCLDKAAHHQVKSLVFPVIGTGQLFNFPLREAVQISVRTLAEWLNEVSSSTVEKIFFCDVNGQIIDRFPSVIREVFKIKDTKPTVDTSSSSTKPSANPTCIANNICISLVSGNIASKKADVIVNSTNPELQLNKGTISKIISGAAGAGLEKECKNKKPNGIKHGELLVTGGHNLNCTHVFHGSIPDWNGNGNSSQQTMKSFWTECLSEASRLNMTSILSPTLGTGYRKFPIHTVANDMFEVVKDFAVKNPQSSLKNVMICAFENAIMTEFKKVERKYQGTSAGPARAFHSEKVYYDENTKGDAGKSQTNTFQVGPVRFSVHAGDILKQNADCIVHGTNSEFSFELGPLSKQLAKRGGRELDREVKSKYISFGSNGVVTTSAPGLVSIRNIIHFRVEEQRFTGCVNDKHWKSSILKCLLEAENGNNRSVIFPALGTGSYYGLAAEKSAEIMVKALETFVGDNPNCGVNDVRVVIFDKPLYLPYLKGISERLDAKANPGRWNIFRRNDQKVKMTPSTPSYSAKTNPMMVTINLASDREYEIQAAITEIENGCSQECIKKTINEEVLRKVTADQEEAIRDLERRHSVKVTFERRLGRLSFYGLKDDVYEANDEIHTLLHKLERGDFTEERAGHLQQIIKWQYEDYDDSSGEMKRYDYPKSMNFQLEKAYQCGQSTYAYKEKDGQDCEVNFKLCKDRRLTDGSWDNGLTVIRVDQLEDAKSCRLPTEWEHMEENVAVVTLPTNGPEYKNVERDFLQSLGSTAKVNKIDRIQNTTLFQQYMSLKDRMEKQNPAGVQNEQRLWHGTKVESIPSINAYGFNRSYCGGNAGHWFGQGVYFALKSSYPKDDNYTPKDAKGQKHMYQVRVLTGEYTKGASDMRVPPVKCQKNGVDVKYDTLVNDVTNPIEFVCFHDCQAYPEYLIAFVI